VLTAVREEAVGGAYTLVLEFQARLPGCAPMSALEIGLCEYLSRAPLSCDRHRLLSTGQLHHASLRSAVKQDFVADSCKRAASMRHKWKGQSRVQIRVAACACAITAARLKCAALMVRPCRAGEARHDAGDVDRSH